MRKGILALGVALFAASLSAQEVPLPFCSQWPPPADAPPCQHWSGALPATFTDELHFTLRALNKYGQVVWTRPVSVYLGKPVAPDGSTPSPVEVRAEQFSVRRTLTVVGEVCDPAAEILWEYGAASEYACDPCAPLTCIPAEAP